MNAPAINIVMTYRPEVMMAFQASHSFKAFEEERKKLDAADRASGKKAHTYIFNNSPASTFLKLQHVNNKTDGMFLEVELIDPQGLFEEAMLDNSVEAMLPIEDNPLAARIKTLQRDKEALNAEALELKRSMDHKRGPTSWISSKERKSLLGSIADKQAQITSELVKLEDVSQENLGENVYLKRRQQEALKEGATSQFQRPLYVTYGIGDNLLDWSRPQCFGNIFSVKYSFNGSGARKLSLKMGSATHPNLLVGEGLSVFGEAFTKGLLTKGSSDPLFNKDQTNSQRENYKKYLRAKNKRLPMDVFDTVDTYINASKPSFHLAVTQALTEFIKAGTQNNNVLVLLPDLDKYLANYLETLLQQQRTKIMTYYQFASLSDTEWDLKRGLAYYGAFREALEGIGLGLSESSRYAISGREPVTTQPIGRSTFANLEKSVTAKEEIVDWFQSREIKAIVQCDYDRSTSFLDKLQNVAACINNKIVEFSTSSIPAPNPQLPKDSGLPIGETDFNILTLMKEATLIPSDDKPALIWGDSVLVTDYLLAHSLEKTQDSENTGSQRKQQTDKLKKVIHPMDILNGLNYDYMQKVEDYIIPIPWLSAFGQVPWASANEDVSMFDTFAGDSNILSTQLRELKRTQPIQVNRMPVFSFGTSHPNILSVDFEIDAIYYAALGMAVPTPDPSNQIATGIIKPGQGKLINKYFKKLEEIIESDTRSEAKIKETRERLLSEGVDIGDKFKSRDPSDPPGLFKRYLENWFGEAITEEQGQIYDTFDALNDSSAENSARKVKNRGGDDKEEYYKFMWKNFVNLYNKSKEVPLSVRLMPSNTDPVGQSIVTSTKMKETVAEQPFSGSISTIPMFHLSNTRNTMGRPCILTCIEPRFNQSSNKLDLQRTWFSGKYTIAGFKHTITNNRAESEFYIMKDPAKGTELNEKSNTSPQELPIN